MNRAHRVLPAAALVLALLVLPAALPVSYAEDAREPSTIRLAELAWLEGSWRAEAFGGLIEEVWLPPIGDSMHAVFRAVPGGALEFSEFIQVTQEEAGVVMRFEHFRADYSTWEGTGPPMELSLTSVSPSEAVFEAKNDVSPSRIVYRRVGDELHVTVTGVEGTIVFRRKG